MTDQSLKGKQFIRGGQIFLYNAKMLCQVSARIGKWAILAYLFITGLLITTYLWGYWHLIGIYGWSWVLVKLGMGYKVIHFYFNHQPITTTAHALMSNAQVQYFYHTLWHVCRKDIFKSLGLGLFIYSGVTYVATRYFVHKGERYAKDRYVAGTQVATTVKQVKKSIEQGKRGISEINIGQQLPIPRWSEFQGFFLHGSTGSGKTQLLMQFLEGIRRRGETAIIYDKEGVLKQHFFSQPLGDKELNPLSIFCENWCLWEECDSPLALGTLASFLMPKAVQGSDPFWVDSARTIFTALAWKMKDYPDKSPLNLLKALLTTTLDEMREALMGTEAANLVDKEIAKTAISIKSVLATYTKSLRFLEGLDKTDKPRFSIKQWIKQVMQPQTPNNRQPQKPWLFITSQSEIHHEIKPLVSAWLGLAMQGIQSLPTDTHQRIWFVIDEAASLHRLETLSDVFADFRKFGGCAVVGVQSISQLEFLYGQYEAHAITDLLNTSIYFRSPKNRIAKWVSQDLGEQTVDEVRESQSYGPNPIRDGNTISVQRVTKPTVSASDIMTLEDLSCYARVVGDHPIAKLTHTYQHRPILVNALDKRKINFDALVAEQASHVENHPLVDAAAKKIKQVQQTADAVGDDCQLSDEAFSETKELCIKHSGDGQVDEKSLAQTIEEQTVLGGERDKVM